MVERDWAAIPFFKRAIDLDPKFASAYAALDLCMETVASRRWPQKTPAGLTNSGARQ